MHKKILTYVIGVFCLALSFIGYAIEPMNLSLATQGVVHYYNSGEYHKDVNAALIEAQNYLAKRIAENKNKEQKLALVLDIDDTSIEEYDFWYKHDFSRHAVMTVGDSKIDFPPIKPTLELYNYAKQNGVAVFFITGRHEKDRQNTIRILHHAGYDNWNFLYMRADNDKIPAEKYKTVLRKQIEESGYDIALSIGDQNSDLKGGYADYTVKVPNPFYYIP